MKIEKRTYTNIYENEVYITEDGQEFDKYNEALRHEIKIKHNKELKEEHMYVETLEAFCSLYKIDNFQDFEFLCICICNLDESPENYFKGPGWYMDIVHYGDKDWHEIIFSKYYIEYLEEDLLKLKNLTSD